MRRSPRGAVRQAAVPAAFAVLLLAFAGAAAAASIEAEIDRNEATLEHRLVLTLTVSGAANAEPILPDLAAFEVHPAGQSKQWNFINGRASSSVTYSYVLIPLETGEFVIGPAAVEVDGERFTSQPFTVRIRAAGAVSGQQRDLFVTTQLSTTTPYVGQQVLFTWRLYRRVRIADARLDPFEFNGFLVEDLGEVREFETRVNGRTFMVSEIRKALFPQEEGELLIPATRLTCQVATRSRRSSNLFDDVFGRIPTESKVLRSDPLQVRVRPLPDAPPGFSGLVGSFDLAAEVSQREMQVGESVTLTLEVSGSGNVQMIPEPALPELAAVKVYDDKPGSSIQRKPSGLSGSRTFRKALVPQTAGTLTLPPVRLVYFDPSADGYRTAATAEIPMQVLPAEGEEELRRCCCCRCSPTWRPWPSPAGDIATARMPASSVAAARWPGRADGCGGSAVKPTAGPARRCRAACASSSATSSGSKASPSPPPRPATISPPPVSGRSEWTKSAVCWRGSRPPATAPPASRRTYRRKSGGFCGDWTASCERRSDPLAVAAGRCGTGSAGERRRRASAGSAAGRRGLDPGQDGL
jgi:hypothetical protein